MRRAVIGAVIVAMFALVGAAPAFAAGGVRAPEVRRRPLPVRPGANLILTDLGEIPKPMVNGFMTRVAPNLHYAKANGKCCGAIPRVDVIHLHHGVWLTDGAAGQGEGNGQTGFYPFMASGEEKTIYQLPARLRVPGRRRGPLDPQLHDPQPPGEAREGLHHLRHGLHPRQLAGRAGDHAGASDLDGCRGPPAVSGVQRLPPQRQEREVHVPGHGQEPLRRRGRRATCSRSTTPARWSQRPATCIRAAFTTTST